MRSLFIALLLSAVASAGITCKTAAGAANGSGWSVDATGRGNCGTGVVRPVYYYVDAASYGAWPSYNTTQFDKDIQALFNDAQLGDWVLYTAGQDFYHGTGGGPRITRRQGSGVLTVTTTEWKKLPPVGTRITRAYAPLMPRIYNKATSNVYGYNIFNLMGGPLSADNVTFRGIWFAPFIDGNKLGTHVGYTAISMGNGGRYGGGAYTSSVVYPLTVDGVNNKVQVLSTDGFAVVTPRQQIVLGGDAVSGSLYTVEGVNAATHEITLDRPIDAGNTGNFFKVFTILVRDGESNLQPDNITIEQCLFWSPPPRTNWQYEVYPDSRKATIRDNMFFIHDTDQGSLEPKAMLSGNAYGPHIVENNMFFGGMSIMYGGAFSSTHSSLAGGGSWKYNLLTIPNEYGNVGRWQDVFNESNSFFGAFQPVAGLPANSTRFVLAGRSIAEAATGGSYWTAYNSGVVGTSKPACLNSPGGATSNTTVYCYDGDESRPGQTYCPPVGATGSTLRNGDGVCWEQNYATQHTGPKNLWESKSSSHQTFQYNVLYGYPPIYSYNTGQGAAMNLKIPSGAYTGSTTDYPGITPGCRYDSGTDTYNAWPECNRSFGDHMYFKNNWFKDTFAGMQMFGFYNPGGNYLGRGSTSGDWEFSGNLLTMRGLSTAIVNDLTSPYSTNTNFNTHCIGMSRNDGEERPDPYRLPLPNINFSRNTCYTPWITVRATNRSWYPISLGGSFGVAYTGASPAWDVYSGNRTFAGNVLGRWGNGTFGRATSGADSVNNVDGKYIDDFFPGLNRTSTGTPYWGKNVILGAAANSATLGPFPTGKIWTGCGDGTTNTTPCAGGDTSTGATAVPDFTQVFVNPSKGDFRVKNTFTFGKRSELGQDVGADPDQIPMIRGLLVTPTDRSVVFQYRLTQPIVDIPCVVELHTSPDMESSSYAGTATGFAAELANIATYADSDPNTPNVDSDAYDGDYRDGNRRMIMLGQSANLSPSTTYYYRLSCGGDSSVGMFTTMSAKTGTGTQHVSRIGKNASVANMLVEYGTSYSRATDTISGGGNASASCTSGSVCSVSFTATKGTLLFFRWKERDAGNTVLKSGQVGVMPAL